MPPSDWNVIILASAIALITLLCLAQERGTIRQFKFLYNLISIIAPSFLFLGWYLRLRSHFIGHEQIGATLVFTGVSLLIIVAILKDRVNKK